MRKQLLHGLRFDQNPSLLAALAVGYRDDLVLLFDVGGCECEELRSLHARLPRRLDDN